MSALNPNLTLSILKCATALHNCVIAEPETLDDERLQLLIAHLALSEMFPKLHKLSGDLKGEKRDKLTTTKEFTTEDRQELKERAKDFVFASRVHN